MPYKDPQVKLEKGREYSKSWRLRHPEWKEKRKLVESYKKQYSLKTPEAARAHRQVYVKIKRGELVRPDTCSRCGVKTFVEAAHTSYEKREFVWLCRSCHRKMDAAAKNGGTTKFIYQKTDGRLKGGRGRGDARGN